MEIDDEDVFPDKSALAFIRRFPALYSENNKIAREHLFAVFTSGYSILSTKDRFKILLSIHLMSRDVGATKFEDSIDFLSFVQEKGEEG